MRKAVNAQNTPLRVEMKDDVAYNDVATSLANKQKCAVLLY